MRGVFQAGVVVPVRPVGPVVLGVAAGGGTSSERSGTNVLFRSAGRDGSGRLWIRQENIGGRFETDGAFRGTYWQVEGPEPANDEPPRWTPVPRAPTREEVAGLVALVEEVRRRGPAPEPGP